MRVDVWRYLLFALLVAILYTLAPAAGTESLPLIATGLFLGILGRDIGYYSRFIRVWSATAMVIDWPHLEALLAEASETE